MTVEEAAAILRIGRTKAYELAREWRLSKGESGLPVLDLGNVLRVPRRVLETMIGGPLSPPADLVLVPTTTDDHDEPTVPPAATDALARQRRSRRTRPSTDQLDLFDPPTPS